LPSHSFIVLLTSLLKSQWLFCLRSDITFRMSAFC
jgi:hypothetical protein